MAFFGCQFVFDGISSYEYGLTVYDFGSQSEGGRFTSGASIMEDRTPNRYTPLFYGVTQTRRLPLPSPLGQTRKQSTKANGWTAGSWR